MIFLYYFGKNMLNGHYIQHTIGILSYSTTRPRVVPTVELKLSSNSMLYDAVPRTSSVVMKSE